jgi:hypothetical protein
VFVVALASRTGPGLKLNPEYVRLYDEGRERSNEEEDIVLFYKYAADTGDVDAQVAMGLFYLQGGYGVTRNYPVQCNSHFSFFFFFHSFIHSFSLSLYVCVFIHLNCFSFHVTIS